MTTWLLLVAAVICEVAGSLSLKNSAAHPLSYIVAAVGYLAAFALLGVVLHRGMSLAVANGIWSALGIASTAVLSAFFFDEPLTALMVLGFMLIIAGVVELESGYGDSGGGNGPADRKAGLS